jgi:hypothetical protein
MRRLALVMVVLMGLVADSADATVGAACCACVQGMDVATTGGPAGPVPIPALFCAMSTSGGSEQALSERCARLDGTFICFADHIASCEDFLASEGISCPPAAAAPLLSTLALGCLALGLAGLGVRRLFRNGSAKREHAASA